MVLSTFRLTFPSTHEQRTHEWGEKIQVLSGPQEKNRKKKSHHNISINSLKDHLYLPLCVLWVEGFELVGGKHELT